MSKMDYHNEMIGRILAHLIQQGLRRVDIRPRHVPEIMGSTPESEPELHPAFTDVFRWMIDEGLIRGNLAQPLSGPATFFGVQLTSRGIAVIQAKPDDPELGESIEKKVSESKGDLDASVYTKIGSLVGGMIGGLTKAIGSG